MTGPVVLLTLDLAGTSEFAVHGVLTALRPARIDLIGVLTLAVVTACGGGTIRDVLLSDPAASTFAD